MYLIGISQKGCEFLYLERGSARVVCLVGLVGGVGEAGEPPDVGLGTGSLRVTNGVPAITDPRYTQYGFYIT